MSDDGEPAATQRSVSLMVIAVLASLAALYWASAVFVPLLLGLLLSHALTPVVEQAVRLRLPRALAAGLVLCGIVGATGWVVVSLGDEAVAMVEALPDAAQKLRRGIQQQRLQGPGDTMERVQKAATELERAAEEGAGASAAPPARGVTKVQIEKPLFNVKDYLWPGTLGLLAAAGQATLVLFITLFLLASGDTFRRKMVKIAGPTFERRRVTLEALQEIEAQIQRYLLVQVFTSVLVGLATWLAFLWIGVERAAVWGVAAFALNFIPYLGNLVVTAASVLIGFVQFGTFEMALLIGGAVLVINSIEGYLLTPWLTSKSAGMNPVAVFVGVLAWGWLWGVWGLFLAMPIMTSIKVICDRIEHLKPIGELLGE